MIVAVCQHESRKKFGKTKAGTPRYRCKDCGKCFTESTDLFDGMRIGLDKAEQIVEMLCEGLSVSTVARLTKTKAHTIIDLMVLVGQRCERYLREHHRGLKVGSIQADEIWGFVACKKKTALRLGYDGLVGDAYCFTAMDPASKLLVCFHFGKRTQEHTDRFCRKLAVAVEGQFTLSTDGYHTYTPAVGWHLFGRTNYGQVIKMYGSTQDDQRHFSPGNIIGMQKKRVYGNIHYNEICTSHCERLNGTIRNYVKRMGRLTYAFSKKWENLQAALALHFAHYNFCRIHGTLRVTPAMEAGITDHIWSLSELLEH